MLSSSLFVGGSIHQGTTLCSNFSRENVLYESSSIAVPKVVVPMCRIHHVFDAELFKRQTLPDGETLPFTYLPGPSCSKCG